MPCGWPRRLREEVSRPSARPLRRRLLRWIRRFRSSCSPPVAVRRTCPCWKPAPSILRWWKGRYFTSISPRHKASRLHRRCLPPCFLPRECLWFGLILLFGRWLTCVDTRWCLALPARALSYWRDMSSTDLASISRPTSTPFCLAAKDGPPMVLNGDPAALWGGGLGWPAFDAVARGPVGARFIGLTADEVEQVRAKHSFLRPMEVSAGAYAGQSEAAQTVGSWSWLMTRADLPEATVVRLARAIDRAQTGLLRRFAAAEAHARATLAALPAAVELHEGVSRYHREVGRSP